MADRPIIFSAPMVRALLDGRKTQTRRVIKPQPYTDEGVIFTWSGPKSAFLCGPQSVVTNLRAHGAIRYATGDRLWVREAYALLPATAYRMSIGTGTIAQVEHPTDRYTAAVFREGFDRSGRPAWRPSIHMPRWASRLTLTVTDVRVQRLQEISEADALAEGVTRCTWAEEMAGDGRTEWHIPAVTPGEYPGCTNSHPTPRGPFMELWDQIHGPGAWAANPLICAITFDVHHCNIDQMPGAAHG